MTERGKHRTVRFETADPGGNIDGRLAREVLALAKDAPEETRGE
jgi:hypothetical protein